MLRSLLDLVYPRVCLSCARLLAPGQGELCARCFEAIERAEPHVITRGPVSEVVALYVFEEQSPVRALLHTLKYGSVPSLATRLGRALGELVAERSIRADLVIPVPLSRRKRRERGFNQAKNISVGVSAVTGIALGEGLVTRIRDTPSQTTLSAQERRENVLGAFSISPAGMKAVAGTTCLLIDDVVTTGATVFECASVLRSAGASRVIACAVAVAKRTAARIDGAGPEQPRFP